MLSQEQHQRINFYLFGLLMFVIPIYYPASSLVIILLTLNSLLSIEWDVKLGSLKENKLGLLFIGSYLLLVLGAINSDNQAEVLKDLEVKLSLLLAPLVLASFRFSVAQIRKVADAFILGNVLSMVVFLALSIFYFQKSGDVDEFFYHKIARWIHPGYYSVYLNFVLAIIVSKLVLFWEEHSNKSKMLLGLYALSLSVFIFLLVARIGVLIMFMILGWGIVYLASYKREWKVSSAIVLVLGLSLYGSTLVSDIPQKRFGAAITEMMKFSEGNVVNSADRPFLWSSAFNVFKQHPFIGVGTGDIQEEMQLEYKERGLEKAYHERLNPHNQFLQNMVANGILGGVFLILMNVVLIIKAYKSKSIVTAFFVLITATFMFFESALEAQAGIVFYCFVALHLYNHTDLVRKSLKLSANFTGNSES